VRGHSAAAAALAKEAVRALKSGDVSPHSKSEIIRPVNPVDFETFHSIHKSGRGVACEPGGKTPFVISRRRNNAVPRWIIMDVIQPR